MKSILSLSAVVSAVSFLLVACEPMDAIDPFGIVHDDDDSSESTSGSSPDRSSSSSYSSGSSSSSYSSGSSLSGTWSGISASGQVRTKLSLSESGGRVSGSLTWPGGDKRSISGTHSGSSVTLHIGGGDTWRLSYSGSSMSGTGYKYGTSRTYNLSFHR